MESFEGACWNKFQHLLEIRMLELKMEANFEDGLEEALKEKKFEYKQVLKTADFTLRTASGQSSLSSLRMSELRQSIGTLSRQQSFS